jgi:hypothetical protein
LESVPEGDSGTESDWQVVLSPLDFVVPSDDVFESDFPFPVSLLPGIVSEEEEEEEDEDEEEEDVDSSSHQDHAVRLNPNWKFPEPALSATMDAYLTSNLPPVSGNAKNPKILWQIVLSSILSNEVHAMHYTSTLGKEWGPSIAQYYQISPLSYLEKYTSEQPKSWNARNSSLSLVEYRAA